MMLCSEDSLSPSVIFASISAVAFLSLRLIFAPDAMFFKPGGTIMGGRGLSESGSTYELIWTSLGVPLKAGEGSLRVRGTRFCASGAVLRTGESDAGATGEEGSSVLSGSKR